MSYSFNVKYQRKNTSNIHYKRQSDEKKLSQCRFKRVEKKSNGIKIKTQNFGVSNQSIFQQTQKTTLKGTPENRMQLYKKQIYLFRQPSSKISLLYQIKSQTNNYLLIQKLLRERLVWIPAKQDGGEPNFVWGYDKNNSNRRLKKLVSRLSDYQGLTNKGKLYDNVIYFCRMNKVSYERFLPITFFFNSLDHEVKCRNNVRDLLEFFKYVENNTNLTNTWMIKPTDMNQGRSIKMFNNLKSLSHAMKISLSSEKRRCPLWSKQAKGNKSGRFSSQFIKIESSPDNKSIQEEIADDICEFVLEQGRCLVIQKYIQNPMVIDGYKFDIRVWVLVDQLRNYYIYEQYYLRFSSQKYQLSDKTISNNYIHLTNVALQRNTSNYDENKNIRSMNYLEEYMKSKGHSDVYGKIWEEICRIVKISLQATITKSVKHPSVSQFQIFGYDFLLDRDYNVRLIEVNSNPSITEDGAYLAQIIPKMIDETFAITLEKYFGTAPRKNYYNSTLNNWKLLGKAGLINLHEIL